MGLITTNKKHIVESFISEISCVYQYVRHMMRRYSLKPILFLLGTILLSGCASTSVTEENRNTDGTYDGSWVGTIKDTPSNVYIKNWKIGCWNMAGTMRLRVKDGEVRASWNIYNRTSYVDNKGNFRIVIPAHDKLENNPQNSTNLLNGTNYIIAGSLAPNKLSGRLTFGYEDFANQGCSSKIKIKMT